MTQPSEYLQNSPRLIHHAVLSVKLGCMVDLAFEYVLVGYMWYLRLSKSLVLFHESHGVPTYIPTGTDCCNDAIISTKGNIIYDLSRLLILKDGGDPAARVLNLLRSCGP